MSEPIRVFVGCAPEHELAVKVLEYSIRSNTKRSVQFTKLSDIQELIPIPVPKERKQRPVTTFSFQRFLIPQWCDYKGKGIYLDSDQLVIDDIGDLWDRPFNGADILTSGGWQSAVMLINCKTARWNIADLVEEIDEGKRTYVKMMNLKDMGKVVGGLGEEWNWTDRSYFARKMSWDTYTRRKVKLIHYTDMNHQPWLWEGHPLGVLWDNTLLNAIRDQAIDIEDVRKAIAMEYVRPSLALLIHDKQHKSDSEFVFPDVRAKGVGLHR